VYNACIAITENVCVERLGMSESGTLTKSSTQIPPLTGLLLPVLEVGVPVGPQELSNNVNADRNVKTMMRSGGRDFPSMLPSLEIVAAIQTANAAGGRSKLCPFIQPTNALGAVNRAPTKIRSAVRKTHPEPLTSPGRFVINGMTRRKGLRHKKIDFVHVLRKYNSKFSHIS
jgi:hypothetical protein